ncbi:hypothetical protein [Burkholderia sp. Bp9012]|uniref:hypothetical protein n=1 Tax=Burkholderia sp. Bp9012 TaxID=2184562 RepID=UPI000F5950AE|nr:hypothetical protein [Burkholderia sp. Bp9012]
MVNGERHATSRGYPTMGRIAGNANCNTRRIQIMAIVSGTVPDPVDQHEDLESGDFLASPTQISAIIVVKARRGFDPISSSDITVTIS